MSLAGGKVVRDAAESAAHIAHVVAETSYYLPDVSNLTRIGTVETFSVSLAGGKAAQGAAESAAHIVHLMQVVSFGQLVITFLLVDTVDFSFYPLYPSLDSIILDDAW